MTDADMPYRTRLRARMLQIAERILEDEGLAALQARRIAKEADCAVGTLYNVFGGLDGLIIAANTETLKAFGRMAEAAIQRSEGQPLEDRLLALALAYLDFAIAHQSRLKAVFDHTLSDLADVPATYRADQDRLFALVETPLASHVADERERAVTARTMFAAVHGVVLMALDRKLGPFNAKATEQQVRMLVAMMVRGLKPL